MSGRRRSRERPATAAEQAELHRVAELAGEVLAAPAGERPAAAQRLRRAVDRLRDPGNLANVPRAELLATLGATPESPTPRTRTVLMVRARSGANRPEAVSG